MEYTELVVMCYKRPCRCCLYFCAGNVFVLVVLAKASKLNTLSSL
jgi:hypothetical protein